MGTLAVFPPTPETFTRLRAVADTGPFARFDAAKKGLLSAGNDWPATRGRLTRCTFATWPKPPPTWRAASPTAGRKF